MSIKEYQKNQEKEISPYFTPLQVQKIKAARKRKALREAVANAGRSDAAKAIERALISNPTTRAKYTFHNYTLKKQQDFYGVEFTEFTACKQDIIHGVITINEVDDNGKKIGEKREDLYMFQPRFEGRNHFVVGPIFKSDGTMNNNAAYAYKDPKTGVVYIGSIPKREIISNRVFDFDQSNKSNFDASCRNVGITHRKVTEVVSIKYDRDPRTGNIKIVDLNNPQEKAKLAAYYQKHPTSAKANDMIEGLLHRIEVSVEKFEKITDQVEAGVARAGIAAKVAESAAEERAEAAKKQASTPTLADENAELINRYIKYGVRPSYSSPIDDGYGGLEFGGDRMPPPPPHEGHHGPRR